MVMVRIICSSIFVFLHVWFLLCSSNESKFARYEVTEEVSDNETTDISEISTNKPNITWMLMPDGRDGVQPAIISGLYRNDEDDDSYRNNESVIKSKQQTIKFFLFTKENEKRAEVKGMNDSCLPIFKYFKNKKKSKVLIHGFGDNVLDSYMVTAIKDAYLSRDDYNIFAVDWSELAAKPWYLTAKSNTVIVAKHLGRFIDHMSESTKTKSEDFHLIGFSLGAHVAGITTNYIKSGKVRHITGLDPAYVLYSTAGPDRRLDASQAEVVDVIHTTGGYIGYEKSIGLRDFYPNGGIWPQPGCVIDFAAVCSHQRAYYYYGEAVKKNSGFRAIRCESYGLFVNDKCVTRDNETLELGKVNLDRRNTGNYFLDTNPDSPFGKIVAADVDFYDELNNLIT